MRESDSLGKFIGQQKQEAFCEPIIQSAVEGKCVLVTGAAGFIGSALVRALARCGVGRLLLLDIAESGLHDLSLDIERNGAVAHEGIVGDVCDAVLLSEIFERYGPQIVLHAAACKHVPLMESNPFAAARTNVLGMQKIAIAASKSEVDQLILISTDKAVVPSSIMGATKRIAELIVLANHSATRMKAVRLGNVWGSTGSIVPILQRQIAQGGPLTLTDAGCTRHFLSIEEAVQRLLSALLSEQSATIFLSEVGRPYSILELAEFLLKCAGVSREAIELQFIGLRPGEKISECMTSQEEELAPAVYGLQEVLCSSAPSAKLLGAALDEIAASVHSRDLHRLLQAILSLVPAYTPSAYLLRQASNSTTAVSIA